MSHTHAEGIDVTYVGVLKSMKDLCPEESKSHES